MRISDWSSDVCSSDLLRLIIDQAQIPVLVDAGVGTASDAAVAMELGCDAILMNTAISGARNPVLMASAMKKAVEAGREAFLAGRVPRKFYSADPSSPTEGLIPSRTQHSSNKLFRIRLPLPASTHPAAPAT